MPALRLLLDALSTTTYVAGPILVVALVSGIAVGLLQAVLQINEASLSFLVKLVCVAGLLVVLGGTLAGTMIEYTRRCFASVAEVTR